MNRTVVVCYTIGPVEAFFYLGLLASFVALGIQWLYRKWRTTQTVDASRE